MGANIGKYRALVAKGQPVWAYCECGDQFLLFDGRVKCWACSYSSNARYKGEKSYKVARPLQNEVGSN